VGDRIWTKAQLSAIEYRGKNLLVSAAAGSGKTATLTERIIRLITDESVNADISRMLVVTFTKAAASELRERVTSALADASAKAPDNRHLSEQLCRIGSAMICTMDSFFLSCVKPMFDRVGLPADFRIGDKAELLSLREEAMEETVNMFFNSSDDKRESAISAIAEAIGSARTEAGLDDILLEFEEEAGRGGIGDRELFLYADELERLSADDIFTTSFGKCIIDEVISVMEHYKTFAETVAPIMAEEAELVKSYVPAAYSMAEYCDSCADAARSGDIKRLRLLLSSVPEFKIRATVHTNESEMFKAEKGAFTKTVGGLYSDYFSDDPAVCADVMRRTAEICRVAGEVIGEFRKRYAELKRRRGITDHSDVAKMAASLLADENGDPTAYGETVASKYDYVFIDEYQDTSIYQDRIFAAVASKCGRFMVGDIKQSIYRFRGGEPRVFTGYREAWADGTSGETVFMSENFRCSEQVVKFVNAVSRYMFPYGGISFEEGDLLVHGRREIEGDPGSPVEVCLVERPGKQISKKEPDAKEEDEETSVLPGPVLESEYIARRIRHMLDHETLPDGSPIKPKDIAVMFRSGKSRRDTVLESLLKYDIPVNDAEEKPLLERPEIQLLICILKAIDNPTGDIHLAGAMRSAVFGFTLGDIAEIKHIYKKAIGSGSLWDAVRFAADDANDIPADIRLRCSGFLEKMTEYRAVSGTLTAAAFLYRLIHEPAVSDSLFAEGGIGATDRAIMFYEFARSRDGGLYEFLEYVGHLEKNGIDTAEKSRGEGVSLITVHHSKGLEFPVCFLMSATQSYNTNDRSKTMLLDRSFGVAMKLPDDLGVVRCDNILRRLAVFRSLRESAYEEMRVLYVAMTRARERLIVTGVTSSAEKTLGAARDGARFFDEYSVMSKNCYMDIILEAMNLYGGKFASIITVPYDEITDDTADDTVIFVGDTEVPEADDGGDISSALKERFGFEYKYTHLQSIPSKLTVSRLYPEILDEYDDGSAELTGDDMTEPSVPRFMEGTAYSPADAGSAAHIFLQFCDFEKLRDFGVGAELCRLVANGFMSRADGEAANLEYIENFRRSELFKRIISAREVRREFRFNAAIPAAMFTGDSEKSALLERDGVDVIAQGVIDIVFTDENGRLVLADYKTDHLTDYELEHKYAASEKLWKRHGNQLGYYSFICEKLFGRAPDEVLIYSMPLGETV